MRLGKRSRCKEGKELSRAWAGRAESRDTVLGPKTAKSHKHFCILFFCILYFIPSMTLNGGGGGGGVCGRGYVSAQRKPLEHPVQPLSLTERETEVQKEGRDWPIVIRQTGVGGEKARRPERDSSIQAGYRTGVQMPPTAWVLWHPCRLPRTPTHISVTTGTSTPASRMVVPTGALCDAPHAQTHTQAPACRQALPSPGSRAPPASCAGLGSKRAL